MKISYIFFTTALTMCFAAACGKEQDKSSSVAACVIGEDCYVRDKAALDVSNVSAPGGTKSHNVGQNCLGCHQDKGPGKGLFVIAGSLYKSSDTPWVDGATVKLFSDKARTQLVTSVNADALGNFYSTDKITVPAAGLFVSIFDLNDQKLQDMGSPKISFACNICHAGSAKLVVKPKS
jgi:hypothetical protein